MTEYPNQYGTNPWEDMDDNRFFDDEPVSEELMKPERQPGESEENKLRPLRLRDYYGQERVRDNLKIFIEASEQRGEPLDHVLLYGPPGLGKTTLAGIIAHELNVNLRVTSGPAISKAGDLAAILTNLEANDVLFIDEIHRLNHQVEEVLYPAMEDYSLDILIGKGPSARSIRIDLQPFTLIGATTRAGLLTAPLRDRFGMTFRLELYDPEELVRILERDAAILNIAANREGLLTIAKRSRGTPRIAIRLLKRLRDFAQVRGDGIIDEELANKALAALEIDELGLDSTDLRVLTTMAHSYGGGPVGLETLAASTGEDAGTIEDMYEPYLLQIGYLSKTPRGRVLTDAAWAHIGMEKPVDAVNGHEDEPSASDDGGAEPATSVRGQITLSALLGEEDDES